MSEEGKVRCCCGRAIGDVKGSRDGKGEVVFENVGTVWWYGMAAGDAYEE